MLDVALDTPLHAGLPTDARQAEKTVAVAVADAIIPSSPRGAISALLQPAHSSRMVPEQNHPNSITVEINVGYLPQGQPSGLRRDTQLQVLQVGVLVPSSV